MENGETQLSSAGNHQGVFQNDEDSPKGTEINNNWHDEKRYTCSLSIPDINVIAKKSTGTEGIPDSYESKERMNSKPKATFDIGSIPDFSESKTGTNFKPKATLDRGSILDLNESKKGTNFKPKATLDRGSILDLNECKEGTNFKPKTTLDRAATTVSCECREGTYFKPKSSLDRNSSPDTKERLERNFSEATDTSDLRLIVEGKPLYVSRIVLSIVSPVLKDVFSKRPKEHGVLEVQLAGKRHCDVIEFLNSVYPDTLKPVTDDNVELLLDMATEFKVKTLLDRCKCYLLQELQHCRSPDKIAKMLKTSIQFQLDEVRDIAFDSATRLLSDNLENADEFQGLSSSIVSSVFLKRLKLLERSGKKICKRLKEAEAHCGLYHKSERWGDAVCNKCLATVGKVAATELKPFF